MKGKEIDDKVYITALKLPWRYCRYCRFFIPHVSFAIEQTAKSTWYRDK
jgi:hypothetical protein